MTTLTNKKRFVRLGQIATVVLALGTVGMTSACSSAEEATPTQTSTTQAAATTPTPEPSTDTAPATSAPADDSAAPTTAPEATETPDGNVPQCKTADLTAEISQGDAGAGHMYPELMLTNNGTQPCALKGYPGVSLVTGNDGTQLGAPAEMDTNGPERQWLTIKPAESLISALDIAQAANYDKKECQPEKADGFRIYPPGETESLFVKVSGYTGCANEDIKLMQVQALQAAE